MEDIPTTSVLVYQDQWHSTVLKYATYICSICAIVVYISYVIECTLSHACLRKLCQPCKPPCEWPDTLTCDYQVNGNNCNIHFHFENDIGIGADCNNSGGPAYERFENWWLVVNVERVHVLNSVLSIRLCLCLALALRDHWAHSMQIIRAATTMCDMLCRLSGLSKTTASYAAGMFRLCVPFARRMSEQPTVQKRYLGAQKRCSNVCHRYCIRRVYKPATERAKTTRTLRIYQINNAEGRSHARVAELPTRLYFRPNFVDR